MTSAYEFLDEPFPSAFASTVPVNAFTVVGLDREAHAASNVLAFLLDPDERHCFGTTFIDALVTVLAGASTEGGTAFDARAVAGSTEWSVATETTSGERPMVDIVAENPHLDVAIILTSTAGAASADARDAYVARASRDRSTVVTAAFAPAAQHEHAADGIHVLQFDDLFEAADAALYEVGPMADARSLDLYAQFRETRSERIAAAVIEQEQQRLDELWSAIGHRQDQVLDFFGAIDAVNAVLVARATRLQRSIGARLDALGVAHTTWVANAGDHAWGRSAGERALTHVGVRTHDAGSIELLIGWLPRRGTFGYAVKAYATRDRPPRTWDHIPLGLPLEADEQAVADRFVALTLRWIAGERPDS